MTLSKTRANKPATAKRKIEGPVSETLVDFSFGGRRYEDVVDNLSVSDGDSINPDRIRFLLNRAPARYAYWSGIHADIATALREAEAAHDFWIAHKYKELGLETNDSKYVSEKSKMYKVMTANPVEYMKRLKALDAFRTAEEKATILVKSYDMQSRTLQTIAALLRTELEMQGQA